MGEFSINLPSYNCTYIRQFILLLLNCIYILTLVKHIWHAGNLMIAFYNGFISPIFNWIFIEITITLDCLILLAQNKVTLTIPGHIEPT